MIERTYSRADLIDAIADETRSHGFYAGRIRAFGDAGILPVLRRTAGGIARYDNRARVLATVANMLLEWGLAHPQLPESERANPSRSVFWAMAEALDPMTVDFILNGARNGQDWVLRIDRIADPAGPRFLARAYPMTADRDYGETPEGCTSTLGIGLRPLLSHLAGEG